MGHIYWIASYPKSGNTWMRAFLAAIVTGAEENGVKRLDQVAPDENLGRFFQPFRVNRIENASPADLAMSRPKVHRALAATTDNFMFVKTHSLLGVHDGTPTITEEVTAGAIYVIRNPLDVAVSASAFRNRTVDETIAMMNESGYVLHRPYFGVYDLLGSWSEHVESWTREPHDRLPIVRYEDMLDDPDASFRRVLNFLHMRVDDGLLTRALQRTSFEALRAAEEKGEFRERPRETGRFFRSGKKDQWRDLLTDGQIGQIVRGGARQMQRFGYWEPKFDKLVSPFPSGSDVTGT